MTFYEHNNSGPQAGLGKAIDVYSICVLLPPTCTTECLFFQVIALVDVFLSRNIVLTLLAKIEAPLSFSVKDYDTRCATTSHPRLQKATGLCSSCTEIQISSACQRRLVCALGMTGT